VIPRLDQRLDQGDALVPRRSRPPGLLLVAVLALLLSGCSSAGTDDPTGPAATPSARTSSASAGSDPTVSAGPLLTALDVCSLATPAQVRRAAGQVGEPTSRQLTTVKGYGGLVDQCGFGVSFDSYTFRVSVGLTPATRADLDSLPGESVDGVGDAALAADLARFTTVWFLRGSTLVQVLAVKPSDEASRLEDVTAVAAAIARRVPTDPPETDDQTEGVCSRLDQRAVEGVLGAPAGVSRTLEYKDRSAMCTFATGPSDPRTVTVGVYSNVQAGPFFLSQKDYLDSRPVPGIDAGTAFTIPGTAYVVGEDGQAVSVVGHFPAAAPATKPVRPTPELTALLTSAATLMQ
jgi:hypothetical protein